MPSRLPLLEFRRMFQCLERNDFPVESLRLMNETLHTHRLSRKGPVNREVSAALTRMDLGKDLTKIWRRLDEYVTTDSEERCSKIRMDACEMANRLHVAQTGLAEAVYRREWNDEWSPSCPCSSRARGVVDCLAADSSALTSTQ